jgi:hypothetical protein
MRRVVHSSRTIPCTEVLDNVIVLSPSVRLPKAARKRPELQVGPGHHYLLQRRKHLAQVPGSCPKPAKCDPPMTTTGLWKARRFANRHAPLRSTLRTLRGRSHMEYRRQVAQDLSALMARLDEEEVVGTC